MRAGTILTFTKFNRSKGGLDTSTLFAPVLNQWHINIWTGDTRYVASGGADWDTNNRNWQLVIKDATGKIFFGPAGEGTGHKQTADLRALTLILVPFGSGNDF